MLENDNLKISGIDNKLYKIIFEFVKMKLKES